METPTTPSQKLPRSISDAAWNSLLPFLKASPNVYVGDPETCRRFVSALLWIAKEGATWRAIPNVYGHWNTIYRRFGRWCDAGVFQALHEHFHDAGEISGILIDSTIVRAHSCAAGAEKKRRTRSASTRTQLRWIYDEAKSLSQRCLCSAAVYSDGGTP